MSAALIVIQDSNLLVTLLACISIIRGFPYVSNHRFCAGGSMQIEDEDTAYASAIAASLKDQNLMDRELADLNQVRIAKLLIA